MPAMRFYFDFMSPFSYLAFERAMALAKQHGLAFQPIIIDLSALKLAAGNNGPSTRQQPLKSRYSGIDQQRWSKRYGVPIKRPEINNPQRANVAFCGVEPARQIDYMRAVWKRLWAVGADVSTDAALAEIAAEMKWDSKVYVASGSAPANAEKLAAATKAALAEGIFGVPMIVIDDQMWWGNDRLDFVEDFLKERKSA